MNLTDPIYSDANKAREHLERLHWPHGPVCPHCGGFDRITKLQGKSTRPGVYKCNDCTKLFTVTVGTIMEDSKIPLNKWMMAFALYNSSKKGFSAHQLHRSLGITYKSAWFMAHRIRLAMDAEPEGPLGGRDCVVEADETYVGGKAKNRATRKPRSQEGGCRTGRARRPRPFVPRRQRYRRHPAPARRHQRQPRQLPHDRRERRLHRIRPPGAALMAT